jgi:hypothetical protein
MATALKVFKDVKSLKKTEQDLIKSGMTSKKS